MVKILIAAQAINLASETQRTFQDVVGFTMFAWWAYINLMGGWSKPSYYKGRQEIRKVEKEKEAGFAFRENREMNV